MLNATRIALIPAYQPSELMIPLLSSVKQNGFHVIVVDDGSTGKAAELFQEAEKYAVVLHHRKNLGKGRAIKTGLCYIHAHFAPGYVVVTMDADGQHKVSDALKVCQVAEQQPGRLVLGCRDFKKKVPIKSRLGNAVTRFVYRLFSGFNVYDTQTGLRAFSSCFVPSFLRIPGERYEYEMNVLLACSRKKIPIEEVKIATIYFDQNAGSHFQTVKDSYRIYKEILKFSASSLLSFLVDYSLYSLLSLATAGLTKRTSLLVSNIGARVVSASLNYTLNHKLVFQSQKRVMQSAWQYCLLSAGILIANTLILELLVNRMGMNLYVAKLITELFLFVMSWVIQRSIIFRRKDIS